MKMAAFYVCQASYLHQFPLIKQLYIFYIKSIKIDIGVD